MRPLRYLAAISLSAVAVLGNCLPAHAVAPASAPTAARQLTLPSSPERQLYATPESAPQSASNEYPFNRGFCGVYELAGAVDTATDDVHATLYAKIPIIGRVRLTELSGNLDQGITRDVNAVVAKGTFSLWVDANRKVWAQTAMDLKFIGRTDCKAPILTLP
ncbi:hypothetical protein [Streptacidiphilus sp. EB129]|jgi:hypothetical protein|uniref:hypothetical protein n=1 Tax=Streptacidiphilus sp. EB129 TaxID=3156262 RepID=UPI0035191408